MTLEIWIDGLKRESDLIEIKTTCMQCLIASAMSCDVSMIGVIIVISLLLL